MSRCLGDQTLLWLSEGEGTHAQRVHLETCAACMTRYQRLVDDLKLLRHVLQEASLPQATRRRPRTFRARWLPVAAALALALAGLMGGLKMWSSAPPTPPLEARHEAMTLLQAALDGGWPCNGQEPFFHPSCDQQAVILIVGGP
jgi:hypothetical protein